MPLYMLDTNICVYIKRKRPQTIMDRFNKVQRGEVVISPITLGELHRGVEKSNDPAHRQALTQLTVLLPVVPLDEAVSEKYGIIRADLARRGEMIGANDLWIAAHALQLDVTLVTNNEREFARIQGLKVENWA
jgi:tRNA(fMet)-specific endonuclease VapC